ncbi:MAG: NAD-dependent epimerase/dehydratase family protein [Actinomycetota bacterium]
MKACVTGGAGFIGSHLVNRLESQGDEVLVIDDLSAGTKRLSFIETVQLERMDIRDEKTAELVRTFRPDVIFHLAAQMDVRRSVADPLYDAGVNVLGALNILEAAKDVGSRFVFASSGGCVYGEPEPELLPISEVVQGTPTSPYGISKKVLHDYLAFYGQTHGLRWVTLALANVYGPRQDQDGEGGVVEIFGSALVEGRQCLIFGDGKQTRDFVFVDDIVDGFIAAIGKGDGEIFNIGTGQETSVEDLYQIMARISGVEAEPRYEPARAGELQRNCLDPSKANETLSWRAQVSLEAGLTATLDSIRRT